MEKGEQNGMLKETEIKRFIDDDRSSEKKRMAVVGERYKEGKHDILQYRLFFYDSNGVLQEDKTRSNIKIPHPFFRELNMQLSSYMLSFSENPIRAKENTEGLQDYLDEYFDDEFWTEAGETIEGADSKGFDYMYGFKGSDDRMHFMNADSLGVVEIRAQDTDDQCEYIIYWYIDRIDKGRKTIKRIQVWDSKQTTYYVQVNDGKVVLDDAVDVNPRPHVLYHDEKTGQMLGSSLGYIPFWRLDNNKKQQSTLKTIKGIIDDYDLHNCALSNNLVDFDHPIYAVSGYDGSDLDELMQNLRTKKTVGVDADGGIDIKTVDIPYQARKEKLETDEKNIYRFGMGLNTSSLKDTSATTNIAIKMAYTLLDLKANRMEGRLKKMLKQILKVVLAEINEKNDTDFKVSDTYFDFTREVLVNETENINNEQTEAQTEQIKINNLLNAAASIGDEEVLKGICDILDIDYEELKETLEADQQDDDDIMDVQSRLDDIEIDDEEEGGILAEEEASQNEVISMLESLLKEVESGGN